MSLVNFEVQQPYITPSQLLLAIEKVIPSQTITKAIISTSSVEQRQRILPTHVIVALVIAMSFWSSDSVVSVFKNLIHGLASLRQIAVEIFPDINVFFSWLTLEIKELKIPPPQHRSNPRVVKKTRSKFQSKKRCHINNGTPRQLLSFQIFR